MKGDHHNSKLKVKKANEFGMQQWQTDIRYVNLLRCSALAALK